MSLHGKVILVIGGGRGIGAATVRTLAEQGATVVFSYLQNAATANTLTQEIHAKGGNVHSWQTDAHDAAQVKTLVQHTLEIGGRIDSVVCSVPPTALIKPFSTFTWSEFIQAVETELKVTYEVTQAVLPIMRQQRAGHLVFVSSNWAKHPSMEGLTSLTPAFAAQVAFIKALALEIGKDCLTVNAIAPGMVNTDLSRDNMPPEAFQHIAAITPLGRVATPEDVARVISFFASDDSNFMTGTCVPVSGGLTMD